MARLFNRDRDLETASSFGAHSLAIGSTVYENSAVKFWSSLIDEITEEHTPCDTVVLAAPMVAPLSRRLLNPEESIERDFNALQHMNLEQVIEETVAELEMFGGPSGVMATLLSRGSEVLAEELPAHFMDSGIFSYLLAWLLEWAEVPESGWNNPALVGQVLASDNLREFYYSMRMDIRNEHLSEGVFERSVTLQFKRARST